MRAALGIVLIAVLAACPPARSAAATSPSTMRLIYETAAATKLEVARALLAPRTLVTAKTELDWKAVGGTVRRLPSGGFEADGADAITLTLPVTPGVDYALKAATKEEVTVAVRSATKSDDPWEIGVVTPRRDGFEHAFRVTAQKPSVEVKVSGAPHATMLRFEAREALHREPVELLNAEDAALRTFVKRSEPLVERERECLLATGKSAYEWPLAPSTEARVLDLETTVVRRHGDDVEPPAPLVAEVWAHEHDGWKRVFEATRGGDGDDGDFRRTSVPLGTADAIRLATDVAGAASADSSAKSTITLGWARPVVRPASRPTRLPDVFIITSDALRADRLGAYGSTDGLAPKLDALAKSSVVFEEARSVRGETWESLTGIAYASFPEEVGVLHRGDRVRPGFTAIADVFADAGYFTARLGNASVLPGQLGRFDVAEEESRDPTAMHRFDQLLDEEKDRPKFIWVHLSATHYPYRVSKDFVPAGQPAELDSDWFFKVVGERGPKESLDTISTWADGAVRQVDALVGAELPRLQDPARPGGPAVLLFSADHGSHRGEQGLWFLHSTYHRAVLRVPLLLSWPGHLAPRRVPNLVRTIDFGPTLLDLIDAPHESFTGKSLVPLAQGEKMAPLVNILRDQIVTIVETDEYKAFGSIDDASKTWGQVHLKIELANVTLFRWREDPEEQFNLFNLSPLVAGELLSRGRRTSDMNENRISPEAVRLLRQAGYAGDH